MNQNLVPNLRFTGIFIPAEILSMKELSFADIIMLSWIDALHSDEHNGCFASNAYFAERLGLSEETTRKSIAKLKGLNLVEQVSFDGKTRVIRACKENWFQRPKSTENQGGKNPPSSSQTGRKIPGRLVEKSHPSYIYSKEERKEISPQQPSTQHNVYSQKASPNSLSLGLSSFLFENIKKINPKHKKPKLENWAIEVDRMLRIDKRDAEEIRKVIEWLPSHDFWKTNILSTEKLRKHFDALWIEMQKKPAKSKAQTEIDEKKKREDLIKENKKFVIEIIKKLKVDISSILKLTETHVEIKEGKSFFMIGYAESRFKQQISMYLTEKGVL